MVKVMIDNSVVDMTDEQYAKHQESIQPEKTYIEKRAEAYGSASEQLEFITENGLEAWQQKVAEIKALYPKPEEE